MNKNNGLVSVKHMNYELELIINKNLYKKNLITKEMYIQAQDILSKLISEEKSKCKDDLCFFKNDATIITKEKA